MAMSKVEIISNEMIKPSAPTPHTLRTHKLSFLDQITPPVFIPLIFFYEYEQLENIINPAKKVQLLKQSLSDALTQFYPLAGRLGGNISIDCNDAGAIFIEAQIQGKLSQAIETPNIEELGQFLPIECSMPENIDVPLAIQVTLFDCGGIAIGVCMSHKVGDGLSMMTFINAWAAIAREDTENIVQPNFNLTYLFPPKDLSKSNFNPSNVIVREKFVTRRFTFTKEKLDILKKNSVLSGSQVKDPTRVEALSSFLWKQFIETTKLKKDSSKMMFSAAHAVDIRSRVTPMLSDHSFGNLCTIALALSNQENDDLVQQLRNEIRKVNNEYVKTLQNGEELLKHREKVIEIIGEGEVQHCSFSSWCRFPVYKVDFGWGKPDWVCTTIMPFENMIIFMNTKCGEGIEAWINMREDDFFDCST